jgi:hypothetical protein
METSINEFSGRVFRPVDINIIKETVITYRNLSQKELASTICELIKWVTPNGHPKTSACLKLLRKLETEGVLKLPPLSNSQVRSGKRVLKKAGENEDASWMDKSEINGCGALTLTIARPGESLQRWRAYIRAYHMIGDANVYGSRIYYIVRSEGRDIGCLQFGVSAWALSSRDEWIGWTLADKKTRLHLVVNNSRMLILPWVRARNLGSRILSLAARQVASDWLNEFCYEPVLLESFVDTSKYKGTIYKASNWTYLGNTKGRGRNDRHTERLLTEKAVYVYPLRQDFRAVLKGEKPWKAVDPDDMP